MDTDDLDKKSDNQLWAMLSQVENEDKVDVLAELSIRKEASQEYIDAASLAYQAALEAELVMSSTVVQSFYYKQGVNLWRSEQFTEAIEAFQVGVSKYSEPDDKVELSKNYWGIADSYFQIASYELASEVAAKSVEYAVASEDFDLAGLSKFLQAKALDYWGREEEAIQACFEARSFRRKTQNLGAVAEIDDYMAGIHTFLGQYDMATQLHRNCLVLADATGKDQAYHNFRLGNSLLDEQQWHEARNHLHTARALYANLDGFLASVADCDYSLSFTYRDDSEIENALNHARAATSLFDALGRDVSYIKGLARIAYLLFSAERYFDAIEINQRIIDSIGEPTSENSAFSAGWAELRIADTWIQLNRWDLVLEKLEESRHFGHSSTHPGRWWFAAMKARALYALDRHEEAMGVADAGLALTQDSDVSRHTAYLYEIKARVFLELGKPDRERHLAHAISLHLALGDTAIARELAEYFKPDFSPQIEESILNPVTDSGKKSEEPISFGFKPLN